MLEIYNEKVRDLFNPAKSNGNKGLKVSARGLSSYSTPPPNR